ncbi:MAG: exopolysaccharide biosynthesis polyprenyl glycosylphosphotransferase [Hyphomonadaceae bacterium]|nr:exopolysaccharide biosynthesis polyprenyl glycosylphosphotransferase [Hyphomonadaceae bacterium]
MSQAALQLVGANLDQTGAEVVALGALSAPQAAPPAVTAQSEAERLAELAAAFALFGLPIDQPGDPEFPLATADLAYRAYQVAPDAPANDWVQPEAAGAPSLPRRGMHVDPSLPAKLVQAADWIVIAAAAQFAALWGAGAGLLDLSIGQATAFIVSALALKVGLWLTDYYRFSPSRIRPERGMGGLALGAILGLLISNAFAPDARGAAALAATLPFAAMLLAGIHAALAIWIAAAHRRGLFAENIVLIGATDAARRLAARAAKSGEARIVAVVDDRIGRSPAKVGAAPVIGGVDALLAWNDLPHVDRIVITVTQTAETRVKSMIERLRVAPNRVDLLLDFETQAVRGRRVERFGGAAVACVSGRPHNHRRAFVKRVEDIVIGALLAAAFVLPMLVIAALVKLDSPGPALYRQRRHGFNNRVITVLKFRTMRHDPDAPLQQVRVNDARITSVGAFLRRTSLDELPQLFNVLRGDMSLVGPRPHAVGMKTCERELTEIVAEYAHRHRVKPGITGWAQVNGSRGPVSSAQSVRRRVRFDLEYVQRSSLWLDLEVLVRTVPVLIGDNKVTR